MSETELKLIDYTWKEFFLDIERIAKHYESYGDMIKNIYAVPRGGLIFGVLLSHRLNVPLLLDKRKIRRGTLIVDDICDSGQVLKELTKDKKFFGIHTLWLVKEHDPSVLVTYEHLKYAAESGTIIKFPWETELTSGRNGTKF